MKLITDEEIDECYKKFIGTVDEPLLDQHLLEAQLAADLEALEDERKRIADWLYRWCHSKNPNFQKLDIFIASLKEG